MTQCQGAKQACRSPTYQKAELVSPLCKLRFEKCEFTQKKRVHLDQFGVKLRKVGDGLGGGLALRAPNNQSTSGDSEKTPGEARPIPEFAKKNRAQ